MKVNGKFGRPQDKLKQAEKIDHCFWHSRSAFTRFSQNGKYLMVRNKKQKNFKHESVKS